MNNTKDNKNADLFITKNTTTKESGTSNLNMINKNTLSLEEIKKRIDEYKNNLNLELNKIIQEEKEKEDERMKKYTEESDEQIKKILEDAIIKERSESSKRVMIFNE